MAPFILGLLKAGLPLLANAALAQGKDWVKEKTGVDLGDAVESLTPEKLTQLKQFELENERELRAFTLENNKLDLQFFQAEGAEKDSARRRDTAFIAAGKRNYRADLMFLLAVVMIGVLVLIVWRDQSINEYVKGIFTLVLGRFLGYLDNIYNYEFGTTRSSRAKDNTIEQLSKGGPQ